MTTLRKKRSGSAHTQLRGLTVPAVNSYTDQINPNLGTSFSAPIVSGIAALMRAVNANLTPAELIVRIKSSASAFPRWRRKPIPRARSAARPSRR